MGDHGMAAAGALHREAGHDAGGQEPDGARGAIDAPPAAQAEGK